MTHNISVLLVEDEPDLAFIIKESLERRGYDVTVCSDGKGALACYLDVKPDVLLLDIMLPKLDGLTLAEIIRISDKATPILFLSAKGLVSDVVRGFDAGGNDYLRKPFNMDELAVRVRALAKKAEEAALYVTPKKEQNQTNIGNFIFNAARQTLRYKDSEVTLTHKESEVLQLLNSNSNTMVPRAVLLNRIWGDDDFFSGRSMDVFISKLRKKLAADPSVKIINLRGFGYKLVC